MNIVIVGGGKKMDFLVRALLKKKNKVTIINESERDCKYLAHEHDAEVIRGDGSKLFVLQDAGIVKADLLIALTPKDADNLIICQLAKAFFKVKRVSATVTNPRNVPVFKNLGIDTVISATYTMANIIEQMASVHEVVNSLSIEDGKIQLIELSIYPEHNICGKQLSDINFPQNAIIGSIIRNGTVFVPNGRSEIRAGDKVAVLTSDDVKDDVIRVLVGSYKK